MPPPLRTLFCAAAGFEAARHLPGLPPGHPGRRLHGHGFVATLRGALPPGWAPFPGGEVAALQARLQAAADRLDHRLLNDTLPLPSDENLARWLHAQLQQPVDGLQLRQLGVRSTADRGVDLDARGRAHLWRRYRVQAAHRLPNVPAGHKCGRMHGHGFEIVVHARRDAAGAGPGPDPAPADPASSPALDHDRLDELWAPLHFVLNHACLNDLPGLDNPTSERLAGWLWAQLAPQLPALAWVTVYETASCGAVFDGRHYRIWKELTLDSAVRLRRAPDGHALRRLHGHTYTLRLHLSAPLDAVLGWAVDFGDVKALFDPIFRELDHQPLHELADRAGLPDGDTATLAAWVLQRARAALPALDRVDLHETAGCGAIVSAGGTGGIGNEGAERTHEGDPALPV
jgi:6-pyruvoyltetrahydropterin/6-carboxytetrahydropterin synthase